MRNPSCCCAIVWVGEYYLFTHELGIQFKKRDWRSADIAALKRIRLPELTNKYLQITPEQVVEIDTKIDLRDLENPRSYYQQKTQHLLNFGVQRVVWLFSDTEKIMVTEPDQPWLIYDWTDRVSIWADCEVVVADLF